MAYPTSQLTTGTINHVLSQLVSASLSKSNKNQSMKDARKCRWYGVFAELSKTFYLCFVRTIFVLFMDFSSMGTLMLHSKWVELYMRLLKILLLSLTSCTKNIIAALILKLWFFIFILFLFWEGLVRWFVVYLSFMFVFFFYYSMVFLGFC